MKNKITILLIILFTLLTQVSCVPLLVGTAVTTGTMVTMQDRSFGNTVDDTSIMIKINKELLKNNLFSFVKVKVSEGRVLLMGTVSSNEKQLEAEKIAWRVRGVKEVINEIEVNFYNSGSTFTEITKDSIISAQIKAKILASGDIKSVNYSVNTIKGTVYIMGIAQNQDELNKVTSIARTIKGVKQVVSYVRFKNSKLRG